MTNEHNHMETFFEGDAIEFYTGKRKFLFVKYIKVRGLRGILMKRRGQRMIGLGTDEGVFVVPHLPLKSLISTISHEYLHHLISDVDSEKWNHHWATERVGLGNGWGVSL